MSAKESQGDRPLIREFLVYGLVALLIYVAGATLLAHWRWQVMDPARANAGSSKVVLLLTLACGMALVAHYHCWLGTPAVRRLVWFSGLAGIAPHVIALGILVLLRGFGPLRPGAPVGDLLLLIGCSITALIACVSTLAAVTIVSGRQDHMSKSPGSTWLTTLFLVGAQASSLIAGIIALGRP